MCRKRVLKENKTLTKITINKIDFHTDDNEAFLYNMLMI